MKDFALASLINRILDCKTKGHATEVAGNVGGDYSDLIWKLVNRLTWKRSLNQNATIHMWFGEIAKHFGDRSAQDVKGECHRDLGLTIRLRDEQFAWVWQQTGAKLDREKQASLLASECLNLSSGMSSPQMREYMDEIERHYTSQGVRLTRPNQEAA